VCVCGWGVVVRKESYRSLWWQSDDVKQSMVLTNQYSTNQLLDVELSFIHFLH
jgi:hypothetical protein